MAENSKISWTDNTANFWMGCLKVDVECQHCYAETLTTNRMGLKIWGPPATTHRQRVKSIWNDLPRWDRDARAAGIMTKVFVMSLGDFMEDHPDVGPWRAEAFTLMRGTTNLIFQFLTKRPENYMRFLPDDWMSHPTWKRVWLGTSSGRAASLHRVDELRRVPCQSGIRWISVEPFLEPLTGLNLDGISWVVTGGQSGVSENDYRFKSMNHAWCRDIITACQAHGVAYFHKQDADFKPGQRPYVWSTDGRRLQWHQFPGQLTPPIEVTA